MQRLVDENGLARSGPSEDPGEVLASPEDVVAFQARFIRLLERRTAIYTMGDSSSLPTRVAVELLRSVCFVLGLDPDEPEVPPGLLSVDLDAEFRRKLAEVGRKVELTEKLWRNACAGMPQIPNVALRDTLASIGDFPRLYDYRSMAHEIPCSIDYPLCHPVPESLAGVDYINEYLRRLLLEFDFLRRFELGSCVRVLANSCPDYHGLLINLYEPIATNAIGRAVIGQDPRGLEVSEQDHAEIVRLLEPLGRDERDRVMREAGQAVCDSLGIREHDAMVYLHDLVPELMPRIEIGLSRRDLRGVFPSHGAVTEESCGD